MKRAAVYAEFRLSTSMWRQRYMTSGSSAKQCGYEVVCEYTEVGHQRNQSAPSGFGRDAQKCTEAG